MKKVVVIGGGTGSFTVLSGLKKKNLDLTAIVTVSDNGGSTGILRDEFGILPVGDFRMAMVALSDANGDNDVMRNLFLYRFSEGTALKGHNFGNLLLTALTDILGTEDKAFEYASKILRVKGKVLPISNEDLTLIAEYENGTIIFGEKNIDEPNKKHDGKKRITNLRIQPQAEISSKAKETILSADFIILGPGDLYTSTCANLVVDGVSDALNETKAKIIYVVNLINKYGQTYSFTAKDYVDEIKKYVKRSPDFVLVNKTPLPSNILKKYESEKGYPVKIDLNNKFPFKVIKRDLLSGEIIKKRSGDVLKRSLIRHDSDKLANVIEEIILKFN